MRIAIGRRKHDLIGGARLPNGGRDFAKLTSTSWGSGRLGLYARRAGSSGLLTRSGYNIENSYGTLQTTARRAWRCKTSVNLLNRKPCEQVRVFGSLALPNNSAFRAASLAERPS